MSRRHKVHKAGMHIASGISKVAPWFVFVTQAISKDMGTISAQTTTLGQLKVIGNVLTGRLTGFNLFKGGLPQFTATRNWAGIMNQYTGLAAAMIGYGVIARKSKVLPKGGYVLSLGKKILPAAILGGFIDAPDPNAPQQQYSAPMGYGTTTGIDAYSVPTGNLPLVNRGN